MPLAHIAPQAFQDHRPSASPNGPNPAESCPSVPLPGQSWSNLAKLEPNCAEVGPTSPEFGSTLADSGPILRATAGRSRPMSDRIRPKPSPMFRFGPKLADLGPTLWVVSGPTFGRFRAHFWSVPGRFGPSWAKFGHKWPEIVRSCLVSARHRPNSAEVGRVAQISARSGMKVWQCSVVSHSQGAPAWRAAHLVCPAPTWSRFCPNERQPSVRRPPPSTPVAQLARPARRLHHSPCERRSPKSSTLRRPTLNQLQGLWAQGHEVHI